MRFFDNVDPSPFGPPNGSGVYAVCIKYYNYEIPTKTKERILYIGSSKNISKRLSSLSHPYRKCYERFSENYLVYTKSIITENYSELEKELIKTYRPLLNKISKNG